MKIPAIVLAVLPLLGQTVQIRKPDGSMWNGALATHPRVLVDSHMRQVLADPDGSGPLASAMATNANPAWRAVHFRTTDSKGLENDNSTNLGLIAVGFYMDNAASFSGDRRQCTAAMQANAALDPALDCYKWYAINMIRNWATYNTQTGLCWEPHNGCGTGQPLLAATYWGDFNAGPAIAYSILRAYLTETERETFARVMLNGILRLESTHTPCENRLPSGVASYDGYFTYTTPDPYGCQDWPGTWYGPNPLPQGIIGTPFWYMPRWHSQAYTDGTTTVAVSTPGFKAETYFCNSAGGAYVPVTVSSVEGTTTFTLRQGFTASTSDVIAAQGLDANWKEGDVVYVSSDGTLPAPLQANTPYYIRTPTTRNAKLSETPQGPIVNITTSGVGPHYVTVRGAGKCHAYSPNTSTTGSLGTIKWLGTWSGGQQPLTINACSGSRAPRENQVWMLNTPSPTMCGWGQKASWHPNCPYYAANGWAGVLAGSIDAMQTSMNLVDASVLPTVYPFHLTVGNELRAELVKVTSRSGNAVTVVRGEFNTQARPWVNGTTVVVSQGGGYDNEGWNNRNLTRQSGQLALALAFADDSEYAREAVNKITDYFYQYAFHASRFYTITTNALSSYDWSRQWHYWIPLIQSLYSATDGAVDYRQPWMKEMGGLRWIYFQQPWSPNYFLNWGVAADNCNSVDPSGSTSYSCMEAVPQVQGLYRGSPEAQIAWKFGVENGIITSWQKIGVTDRLTLAMLLNVDGTETGMDKATQPTTHIAKATADDDTDPTTNYNYLLSRTSWGATSTQLAVLATDFFGEKFEDEYMGHYILGKNGDYFIGQHASFAPFAYRYGYGNLDMNRSTQPAVTIGNPVSYMTAGTATGAGANMEFDQVLDSTDVVYVRINNKEGWNKARLPTLQPVHSYRHVAHFKAAGETEQVVVFDDIGLPAGGYIQNHIPYGMNGNSAVIKGVTWNEGTTSLDEGGNTLTSAGSDGSTKLVTAVVKGGSAYTSDLNVWWDSTAKQLIIGGDCTAAAPCRLKTSSGVFSYTSPATVTFSAGSNTGTYFVTANPVNGALSIAHQTTAATPSCSAGITCGTEIPGWPEGGIRLAKAVFASGALTGCPGSYGSSAGAEDYHCHDRWWKSLYMGNGYTATGGEWMVVHQFTTGATAADPATSLATISPNFAGVQIGGNTPKVAVFGKGGAAQFNSVTFTTNHAGNGQYLIGGLTPGLYRVERNGNTLVDGVAVTVSGGSLTFRSDSGAFSIFQSGSAPPLEILTAVLPNPTAGAGYSHTLSATGGAGAYAWSVTGGLVPVGLTLWSNGVLSGTPTVAGTFEFVAQVRDSFGVTATRSLSATVQGQVSPLSIVSDALAEGLRNKPYLVTLAATGGAAPVTWTLLEGTLPAGVALNAGTGELSGAPQAAGTFPIRVMATDRNSKTAMKDLVLRVFEPLDMTRISVWPTASSALLSFGDRTLLGTTPCLVEVVGSGTATPVVYSNLDQGGLARRTLTIDGLMPGTAYDANVHCGMLKGSVVVQTPEAGTPQPTPVPFRFTAPARLNAQRLMLEYGLTPTVLDQSIELACAPTCAGQITTSSAAPIYVRASWLGSSGQILLKGTVNTVFPKGPARKETRQIVTIELY